MKEMFFVSNFVNVSNLLQNVTLVLSVRKNVLIEDGAMSAETCSRKGDNICILLYTTYVHLLVY